MHRLFFLLLLLQASNCLIGQATFKKKYGTSSSDIPYSVSVLPDNSILIAGGTTGGGLGGTDALLLKLDSDGTVEWSQVFGGSAYDIFTYIFRCSDGNFIAIGQTNSLSTGGAFDIYVVKVDPGGNLLWERTCGGYNNDNGWGVCEVADGYILSGSTTSFGAGNYDIYVEKLDFSGNSLWSKAWGTSGIEIGGEPIPAPNNGVWVGGYILGSNNDGVLLRISASGTLVSATRVNGALDESMTNLAMGSSGVNGSGSTTTYSGSYTQPFLLGFNTSGNLIWGKRYLISTAYYEINAEDCPDGGFVFAPQHISGNTNNAYLVKTDGTGNIAWAKSYTIPGNGKMYHAYPAPDGGFVAIGHCVGAGQDILVIKTDASGNIAGCCPEDAPITAAVITPPTQNTSPSNANGSAAVSVTGENQTVSLTETNICDGSGCCDTDAGSMSGLPLHACVNEPAIFTHNGDQVLDGNDLLRFILFSDPGDTLGSIIATSSTPTFTFNPATMETGVTYYVAAIAGNNLNGNVDLNDPCLDISNAVQLIWHPLPEVDLQADNSDVCPGSCHTLTATLTGTPPFTLTVTSPAGTNTVNIQGNTGTFQICLPPGMPPGSFTVQATMLTDAYCTCP